MRIIVAALLGFSVGNLPDHGTVWPWVKLAFMVVMFVLIVRMARVQR